MKRSRILKFVLGAFTLLTLQSCLVAKDYTRPQVDEVLQKNYRAENVAQDTITMASVPWRELFTDPILQKDIETGLTNNTDIRVAMQQIISAEAYYKQGKAAYYPTLNGNARYTHQELSKNSQFGTLFNSLDQYEINGALSWEADIWGKIRSNKRAEFANYLQTVAAHKAVKTRLIANIASAYYQLLTLDQQIAITTTTIGTRNKGLETSKALKDAGNVTEVGVKQTEAQLYNAQAILIDLKKQRYILENTLSILLGEMPTEMERSTLETQTISTPLATGVPLQLLSNRPDVMQAEYNFCNAFELTNVARANFYPSFTISGSGGVQSLQISQLLNANSLFANIIGGLTQPIFNGRKIRTQYEVSQSQQEQARLNFRQSLLQASKEVSDAMYSYNAATEKIAVKQKEFDSYNLATGYSRELLNNGLANYLEVLIAEENALSSSLDLANAKNAQLQSVVDLYEALGGGWK